MQPLGGCTDPAPNEPQASAAQTLPYRLSTATPVASLAVDSRDEVAAELAARIDTLTLPGLRAAVVTGSRAPLLLLRLDEGAFAPLLATGASRRVASGLATAAVPGTVTLAELLAEPGDRVMIGSPFVSRRSPLRPLGLLQLDGAVLSELQPFGYTRVLGIQGDRLGVVSRNAFHPGLFSEALQVGPGIIEDGRLDISERELRLPAYFRSFVALCSGETVVGISLVPTHLFHVGDAFLGWARESGVVCQEAVNLSGDRETLLALKVGNDSVIVGYAEVKKTALITFEPVAPSS